MTFQLFPDDFQIVSSGGDFLNLPKEVGADNAIRIAFLSSVTFGFEYWLASGGTKRVRENPGAKPADMRNDPTLKYPERVKQFIAAPVWNYNAKDVAIFQVTNSKVIKALMAIVKSGDYDVAESFFRFERTANQPVEFAVGCLPFKTAFPKPPAEMYEHELVGTVGDILFAAPKNGSVNVPTAEQLKSVM